LYPSLGLDYWFKRRFIMLLLIHKEEERILSGETTKLGGVTPRIIWNDIEKHIELGDKRETSEFSLVVDQL
jgi:hypothetical protein